MREDCQKDYSGPDRRRYVRIRATIIEYAPIGKDSPSVTSFTENISAGGVCIFCPHDLGVGDVISMRIFIPYDHDPVVVRGKIVWHSESPFLERRESKSYDVGVEFCEMKDEDRYSIASYINKYAQKRHEELDVIY